MALTDGGFIFGGGTGLNYEELKQRRAIAAALASRQKGFPKTKGEGMTYLGEAIGDALSDLGLRMAERRQKEKEAGFVKGAPKGEYAPAASDEEYNRDRPTTKVDQPQTTTTSQPPPAPVTPAPQSPDLTGWPTVAPVEPWPVSEADTGAPTFDQRFSAVSEPQPDATPVQTASVSPPEVQNMFFSPQMAKSDLVGGNTVPDMANMVAEVKPQAPQEPQEPVPAPDVPLPMGDPRTTSGVRSTMEAVAARGGMTPNAIAGLERNVRDESNFNYNLRHPDQPGYTGEAHYAHGLFQEGGAEWNNFVKWIDQNHPGSDWRDPKLQTQYTVERLQDPTRPDYNRTFAGMNTAPNSGVAADQFLRGYLKPAAQHLEARSASYLRGGGDPTYASRDVQPGGGGEQVAGARVAGEGRTGGAPAPDELAAQRDAVTLALMNQQAQQQPPTQEDAAADSRLQDVVGRRPGSPFYAPTAALGRTGVVSDAPATGLNPMGTLGGTGVDQSIEDRRNAITDALQSQQPTAPVVPQPDPTQAGTSSSPTTSASLPPTSPVVSSDAVTAPPMGATAQAGIPLAPPVGYGGVVAQAPQTDTSQGIRPVPAPDAPPSSQPIPPEIAREFPDPGKPPPEPRILGPSKAQRYWEQFINNPNVSPELQAKAKREYDNEERYRAHLETIQQERYKNARETYEANVKAKREWDLKAPERDLKTRIDRLTIEEAIAKAQNRPEEALKLKADRQIAEQNLEDLRYKSTTQRAQEERQRELNIKKTEQEVEVGKAPPREKIGDLLFERQKDGTWVDVTPGSKVGNIKLTETQAKTLKFFERAKYAEAQLGDTSILAGLKDSAAGKVPMVGNYWTSPQYQKAKSAADAWMLAVLRDESGAVIGINELPQFYPVYFPLPGDRPEVIADKNARRENATRSLVDALGAAKPVADQFLEQFNARATTEPEGTVRQNNAGRKQRVRNGRWEDF